MANIHIRKPNIGDPGELLRDIRHVDFLEWEVMLPSGLVPFAIAEAALRPHHGGIARSASIGPFGKCIALWGSNPDPNVAGQRTAWMVATRTAERHILSLHRRLREEVAVLLAGTDRLNCWAWERNEVHLRWLDHWGFKPTGKVTRGTAKSYERLVEYRYTRPNDVL